MTGLVLLILYGVRLFNLEGERFDWTEYVTLGTLFPALMLTLALSDRLRPALSSRLRIVRLALVAFIILLPIFTLRITHFKYVLIISLVQWLVAREYLKREADSLAWGGLSPQDKILRGFALLFVIVLGWVAASRYVWWTTYEVYVLGANFSFIVFVLALLLVLASLYDTRDPLEKREPFRLIGNAMAILLIAMACVRTDHIFGLGEMFHWISYVGPAESVRQGGWLLWDVPSHYGFLSVLTLAWLPTKTAWHSVFLLNAIFNFLVALMVFFLFRARRTGFLNLFFALATTLAAVFFRSGLAPYFLGPNNLPNTGGLRFFWAFALCAILFWEYRHADAARRRYRQLFWTGSVVWLVGVLWSVESAVYCSAVWLPAFALLVWRRASAMSKDEASFKTRLSASVRWLLLPIALLLATVLFISAFYFLRLGHGPDWTAFVEYARAYSGGFMALPINAAGEVWVLILVFCAYATVAAYFVREDRESAAMPLILGVGCGLWATSSYFVSRSHPNNLHNLSAIFCGVIGLVLYLLERERKKDLWATLVRSSFVPVLTIVLVAVFANKLALLDYINAPQESYGEIERLIPVSDLELDNLLNSAQVKSDDPMVFVGPSDLLIFSGWTYAQDGRSEHLTTYRSWLTIPLYSFVPLDEARRQVYMARFGERRHMGGWLIEHKNERPVYPWLSEYLKLHYTPGRKFESENWQLTWYDYKG